MKDDIHGDKTCEKKERKKKRKKEGCTHYQDPEIHQWITREGWGWMYIHAYIRTHKVYHT